MSAAAALAACGQATTDQTTSAAPAPLFAIIHTNDTHGHDVAVEETEDTPGNFSMAVVAALKTEWEQKGYEVLLVDAGDATQGTPLVDTSSGAPAMAFMNSCGYDLMAIGNHEFDWGLDALAKNEELAEFAFLSANIIDKSTGEPRFTPNKVIELTDGTKVGFFGLTTPSTITTTSPKNVGGFTFLMGDDLIACAQAQVDELRKQGCAMVIALAHLGNDAFGGDRSKDVLERVAGIDLFIDGHDHEEVQEEVNGILLVETGCYLHNIGVIAIDEGVPSSELVAAGTFDGIDAGTQAIIDAENDRVNEQMNVVLGSTQYFLDGTREPGIRTQETNLGDFCTDAYRWTASTELGYEVDAAIINGGAIRSSIEEGDITLGTIKTVQPFGNDLGVVKVTGAQLLEALEAGCQAIGTESALGGFPQVSGIRYTIDASVPFEEGPLYPDSAFHSPAAPGGRITIHDVGGREFDEGETYTIAMSNFLCEGGDTYYAFKAAADAEAPQTFGFDFEAITSYLVEGCDHEVPAEYEAAQDRITIVGV
ncbi:MAG: bifunctional metallophosphatase/5'-nucleotidase [Atopobiaceae bacterium]|nr:bifunctional metallophosphatase/5'-nucleotidase [Atopobiaceae bacterium]